MSLKDWAKIIIKEPSMGEKWDAFSVFERRKWLYMRGMNLEIANMSWNDIIEDKSLYGHMTIAYQASDRRWLISNSRIVSVREYNRRLGREIPEDIEKVEVCK